MSVKIHLRLMLGAPRPGDVRLRRLELPLLVIYHWRQNGVPSMPHMKGNSSATTNFLKHEALKALQTLSAEREIPMAQLLREAVSDLFVKYNVKVPKSKVPS